MLNIFKSNSPYSVIVLLIAGILIHLPAIIQPELPVTLQDAALWNKLLLIMDNLFGQRPYVYTVLALINLFAQAIYLNRIVNVHHLMPQPNYLTAFCFLLFTGFFNEMQHFNINLIGNWFALIVVNNTLHLYDKIEVRKRLFNIGLFVSIAVIWQLNYIFLLPFFIISIAILRPRKASEWIISALGLITPFYFSISLLYLFDKLYWLKAFMPNTFNLPSHIVNPELLFIQLFWIFLLLSIGIFNVNSNNARMLMQTRKSWFIIYTYSILALLGSIYSVDSNIYQLQINTISIALIASNVWSNEYKRWINKLLFFVSILVLIFVQYFGHII